MRLLVRGLFGSPVVLLGLLSCGGGGAIGPEPAKAVFSSLAFGLDSLKVTVGGSVQVSVTPRDQNGASLSGLPAPSLAVEDPAIATLSGTVLTGVAVGSTRLFASLTVAGETHGDTSWVVVAAAPSGGPAHPVNTVGTTMDSIRAWSKGGRSGATRSPGPECMPSTVPRTPS
jgi:hypothetical protein